MSVREPEAAIGALVRKAERGSGEVLWRARTDDGRVDVTVGDPTRPFFIASATKLFVTTILAQLRVEGAVDWDAPIAGVLPAARGLTDGSIRQVMAHTAGLPDYFEGRLPDGGTVFGGVRTQDRGWRLDDVVAWASSMARPKPGSALYSDTGYQLLGALIEQCDARPFGASVRARICELLGLRGTFVFGADEVDRYGAIAPMLDGERPLVIPLAMASVQADGGIVSTLDDGTAFLDAFFVGRLFPQALLGEIAADWHRIFRPLEYGTGVMRFQLPAALTGFRRVPAFIGHSGASGTIMFRNPGLGLTVVGTLNQVRRRSAPYRLMVRTAIAARG
jgi:CubicO group peptidase (beta-lactamase class C family)